MARYTYQFTIGNNIGDVVIETSDTLTTNYQPGNDGSGVYSGYRVTGISGSFNGQQITGLLPATERTTTEGNIDSTTTDPNNTGGYVGAYDNVLWIGGGNSPEDGVSNQGRNGKSYYGFDSRGIAFTAGGVDYRVYVPEISADTFEVQASTQFVPIGFNRSVSTPECFLTTTRIRTVRGAIAVEDLHVGDLVVTVSGDVRPIKWIGSRRLAGAKGKPLPHEKRPVRVREGAFGRDATGRPVPTQDVGLSPGHPVLVGADAEGAGGHLVPIMCLVNGTTIERVAMDEATYWHVELDEHDILLAEGLAAESYIDLGARVWFDGLDGALYDPDMALPDMACRCRPVMVDGPLVEAERRRLDEVFALRLSASAAWPSADDSAEIPL